MKAAASNRMGMVSTSMSAFRGNVTGVRPSSALMLKVGERDPTVYGMVNRPSTPMKAVVGNFYGEVGAF